MKKQRFVELKNEMHTIREKDMQLSTKVDGNAGKLSYNYTEVKSAYKELHADDLPIYRKWECGNLKNYYRGRIADGKLICDKIIIENGRIEYMTTYLDSIMSNDNEESNKEEFNNAICELLKHLEK